MGRAYNKNELEDAFGEWDEDAPVAAGSQPTALPTTSRLSLARDLREPSPVKRRIGFTPESLEEAIRSVMPDEDAFDDEPARYAVGGERAVG